jgi:hypothetical protein
MNGTRGGTDPVHLLSTATARAARMTVRRCSCSCSCRFHGVSWNQEETLVAYVAEAPATPRPAFNRSGYTREEGCSEGDCSAWKGQGVWEEDWGETYSKKGRPSLFVLDIPRSLFHSMPTNQHKSLTACGKKKNPTHCCLQFWCM